MATTINLSDPISTLVSKTNVLIGEVGDPTSLGTAVKTDLVSAINEINTKIVDIDTDQEISEKIETYFNSNQFDIQDMTADSASIANITTHNIHADSAEFSKIRLNLNSGAGTVGNLGFVKPLTIKNSAGTPIFAGYIISTDSDRGTL